MNEKLGNFVSSPKVIFLPVLLLLFQTLGFGRSIPWSFFPWNLGLIFWLLLTVFLIIWLWSQKKWIPTPKTYEFLLSTRALQCWLVLNLGFSLFSYHHFQGSGYAFPFIHLMAIAVMFFWVRADRLGASMIFNLIFLIGSIIHFSTNPTRSDMLPVIQAGLDRWHQGLDPYQSFMVEGNTPDLMSYLPGTMFSHLPAWSLGLDLRWNTVLYRMIWMFLVWRAQKQNPRVERLTLLQYFALSPYINFRHDLYFEAFLLLIVLYFLYPRFRALTLALAICTRQWTWILAPFLFYREMIRNKNAQRKEIVLHGLGLVLVVALFTVLLYRTTGLHSFLSTIFWFQDQTVVGRDYGIGFAKLFYSFGIEGWLQKLQALWCMTVFLTMLFQKPKFSDIWVWALLAWFGFLLLNGHFWLYFWISFVVFSAVAPYEASREPHNAIS